MILRGIHFWKNTNTGHGWCEKKQMTINWILGRLFTLLNDHALDIGSVFSRQKVQIVWYPECEVDRHGTKGMWIDDSWPWPRTYLGCVCVCVWDNDRGEHMGCLLNDICAMSSACITNMNKLFLFIWCSFNFTHRNKSTPVPQSRPKRIPCWYPSLKNTPFTRILDEKKIPLFQPNSLIMSSSKTPY